MCLLYVQSALEGLPLWAQAGADGWAHSAAVPHFRRLQARTSLPAKEATQTNADEDWRFQSQPQTASVSCGEQAQDGSGLQQEDGGWGPETPRHANLLPLSAGDVFGWLIAVVTIFIAAGVLLGRRADMSSLRR